MRYADLFTRRTQTSVEKAKQYISGLFQSEKSHIESISETVEGSDLQNLNHVISQSPWEAAEVMGRIGQDTQTLLQQVAEQTGQKVGYIVDESGWRKQGKQSVGVGRQYLGSLGNVDHGQVAVFGSLMCGHERGLVNTRLFLPEDWTKDAKRCARVGIPEANRPFQTKPM